MAIATQNSQTKELFNRADIRTMKKDLKKLREADALKEREKIKSGNPKSQAPNKSPVKNIVPQIPNPPVKTVATEPKEGLDQILDSVKEELQETPVSAEQEKEQIFLAKAEKNQLEKELENVPTKPAAAIKTNAILEEEEKLQEKLGSMTAE